MKFLKLLSFTKRGKDNKTIAEYKRDVMVNTGREQFKKLKDLGLKIPVRLA